jgi:hypothetical protein
MKNDECRMKNVLKALRVASAEEILRQTLARAVSVQLSAVSHSAFRPSAFSLCIP